MFEESKWLWIGKVSAKDTHAEFIKDLFWERGKTVCYLSCEGDYTLFVNGVAVASNQYGDFNHYKVYDGVDITPYLRQGENRLAFSVWYWGEETNRSFVSPAGLIFEVKNSGETIAVSDSSTLCRLSKAYASGRKKLITGQLGYSYLYDANKEDDWKEGGREAFYAPMLMAKECVFYPRPNKKLLLKKPVQGKIIKKSEDAKGYLVDLGEEIVGLAFFKLGSKTSGNLVTVSYGEVLENGRVKRKIGSRDFSFEYVAKQGNNEFTHYMLRLACRYLEVESNESIDLEEMGLIPQIYPVAEKDVRFENELDQRIYDLCVNTLKLCMMERYVDCPWREQSTYVFDSRNQMLCGYYAFEKGNADFAKSNLKLMSKDRRADELLSICTPCSTDLTIPSFSLHYFTAVREYLEHTGDEETVKEIYPKLSRLLQAFTDRKQDGLIRRFEGVNHWNFYDWSNYLDGNLYQEDEPIPDLMLGTLYILAAQSMRVIAEKIGLGVSLEKPIEEVKEATRRAFFREDEGVFSVLEEKDEYTVLGNALAVLAGLATREESERICQKLLSGELSDCSLSMKPFKYDALLKTDEEKYAPVVLEEIRRDYKKMLDAGSTTAWETIEGASAFGNAGSLCHGWSAIPVYYFHKLLK